MKKMFITMVCLALCGAGSAMAQNAPVVQQEKDKDAGTMKFEALTHDFGEVAEGPVAAYDFEFTNTGKKPVIIQSAMGSCGCTKAKWPQQPILPGKKGTIHVTYDTENRPGPIAKIVTIISNAAEPTMILHIKGEVKKMEASATTVN